MLLALIVLLLAVPIGGAPIYGGTATVTWDLPIVVSRTHTLYPFFEQFVNRVRERSGGRLEIRIRTPQQVPFGLDQYFQAVERGSVPMANASAAFVTGNQIATIPNLPFLIRTRPELRLVLPAFRSSFNNSLRNSRLLFTYAFPSQQILGRGAIPRTLADLRGRRIRAASSEDAEFLKSIGAVPVSLTSTEVLPALERGAIDGGITSVFSARGQGWTEFLTWVYVIDLHMAPSYVLVNRAAYDSLPADLRRVMQDAAAEIELVMTAELDDLDVRAIDELRDRGRTILAVSDADAQTAFGLSRGIWENWLSGKGEATRDALNAIRKVLNR